MDTIKAILINLARAIKQKPKKLGIGLAVFISIFTPIIVCGAPLNLLEVKLHAGTTNLQAEAGMNGLVNWGAAGKMTAYKQTIEIISKDKNGLNIHNVKINYGNCKSSFDDMVEREKSNFNEKFKNASKIFAFIDDDYIQKIKPAIIEYAINKKYEYYADRIDNQKVQSLKSNIKEQVEKIEKEEKNEPHLGLLSDVCINERYDVRPDESKLNERDVKSTFCKKEFQNIEKLRAQYDKTRFVIWDKQDKLGEQASYDDQRDENSEYWKQRQQLEEQKIPLFIKAKEQQDKAANAYYKCLQNAKDKMANTLVDDIIIPLKKELITAIFELDNELNPTYTEEKGKQIAQKYGFDIDKQEYIGSKDNDIERKIMSGVYKQYYTYFIFEHFRVNKPPFTELSKEKILKDFKNNLSNSSRYGMKQEYENLKAQGVIFKYVSNESKAQNEVWQNFFRIDKRPENSPPIKIMEIDSYPKPPKFSMRLRYGERTTFHLYGTTCAVKRVEIETNKGTGTYSF